MGTGSVRHTDPLREAAKKVPVIRPYNPPPNSSLMDAWTFFFFRLKKIESGFDNFVGFKLPYFLANTYISTNQLKDKDQQQNLMCTLKYMGISIGMSS